MAGKMSGIRAEAQAIRETATKSAENAQQDVQRMKEALKSEQGSLLFVKRLTGFLVSTIAYYRNLFEEDDFIVRHLVGVPIMVVRGRGASTMASALSKWLLGALDALEHKYLKSLTMEITDDTNFTWESYKLEYTYLDGEIQCSISTPSNQVELTKLQDSVKGVLSNIHNMVSCNPSLPTNCWARVKIAYQPGTPADYEPPGFRPHNEEKREQPRSLTCGIVNTYFHSLKVSFKCNTKEIRTQVHCLCGKTDRHSTLLQCSVCETIQHAACFKIYTDDDASQKKHTCFQCLGKEKTADYSTEECIFRRAIVLCAKSKSTSMGKISKAFELESEQAEVCMRRLLREEVLKKTTQPFSPQKLDFLYNVNKNKIVNDLKPKYFDV